MDWDKLRVFYNVAESGNFTRAASRLQISQSAISRQISTLEDRIGMPLFHRHARGLILTEQGELLFRTAREVFSELAMVQARISENMKTSQGSLKIAVTIGFGTAWIAPRLHQFLAQYPETRLTLRLSDNPVDLTVPESDVAISSSVTEDRGLIYKELVCRDLSIYSSRNYLLKFGVPLKPQDLDCHRLVVFSDKEMLPFDDANWLLTCGTPPGVRREPYLSINNLYGVARAVEAGSGIGCLPTYIAAKCENLVQILPEIESPHVRFYFIYPRQLKDSKRIEQLWTFLSQEARKEEASMGKVSL
ncbi:MAG: LysR family transcriptional regulator [Alphaproteobacteria bacterium]|jgi:DNA-binding transcriptional LysR family regulator|nr:LysR family transcriptional regulator [Alphaproteobacteria bacterium]MBP7729920.1 LysR family transcriptional regulator [Alphaproteobacteria bacterium]